MEMDELIWWGEDIEQNPETLGTAEDGTKDREPEEEAEKRPVRLKEN